MTIAASVEELLTREGVQYDMVGHERTPNSTRSAQAAHIPGDRLAKCVVLHDDHGYVMAVLPATHKVDLSAVRHQLSRPLGLATDGELADLFKDCEPGAIPPLGDAYGLEAILEERLAGEPEIYFEAGDHLALVHLRGSDFLRLMARAPRAQISQHV